VFKRFVIGFALGMGAMYWYLTDSAPLKSQVQGWFSRSAAGYRGDRTHEAARDLLH
jgi:hypothetical protein